jgi:hypothetical protein
MHKRSMLHFKRMEICSQYLHAKYAAVINQKLRRVQEFCERNQAFPVRPSLLDIEDIASCPYEEVNELEI